MVRKVLVIFILAVIAPLSAMAGLFRHNKAQNPLANVDSKQPDKVLFDRSMDFMKHSKYDQARQTLQVLINTYPDSEYIARAKLAIGDAWYAEGGTTGLAQAEIEYKDFITFFPNMPEAAEAQLKVANIHYRQMEKPDRDFTHAKRAEEEYQQLILQFPDSKLVPQAKQRLREVQEVLAEREYGIGRFYYMRESYPAAIARLKTAVDTYPLYSKAPEALYTLGEIYEKQIQRTRDAKGVPETTRARFILDSTNKAAEVYSRIILNYPLTERAGDAKHRLQALGRPIPTPTSDAVAQDKAIEASRRKNGRIDGMMRNFRRAPDVKQAAGTGEPTMTPPEETSAVTVIRESTNTLNGTSGSAVSLEVRNGEAPKSEAVPHSDAQNQPAPEAATPAPQVTSPAPTAPATSAPESPDTGIPELKPIDSAPAQAPAPQAVDPAPAATSNTQNQAATAPAQAATQASDAKDSSAASAQQNDSAQNNSQDQTDSSSSSKKGKKKGLRKIIPF
ncbi:MAG TPA: outer membrane protein assembly factor BamD [Terriglobales bacterium]|jgi:outer membrane protein assembly factor BamD|nr:outer membrane protein assembly factor BamD [Terriglobales bacterium]